MADTYIISSPSSKSLDVASAGFTVSGDPQTLELYFPALEAGQEAEFTVVWRNWLAYARVVTLDLQSDQGEVRQHEVQVFNYDGLDFVEESKRFLRDWPSAIEAVEKAMEGTVLECRFHGNRQEKGSFIFRLPDMTRGEFDAFLLVYHVPYMVLSYMVQSPKRVPARFYLTSSGAEPVRDWLRDLKPEDRKILGDDLRTLEYGWPMGMPLCRSIASHKGLWEARSSLPHRREARILFCIAGGCLVLLHGFIKKAQKTPKADLDLATRRMKEALK